MKKALQYVLAATMSMTLLACSNTTSEAQPEESASDALKGSFSVNIVGEDYGCGVDKAIITFDKAVDSVSKETFIVEETKQNTDWSDESFPVVIQTTPRTILDAYLVDENCEKTDQPSTTAVIEMNIDPNEGSPFLYTMATGYNTWCDPYELNITLNEGATLTVDGNAVEAVEIDKKYTSRTTSADMFEKTTAEYGGYTYNIATYSPAEKSDSVFVWLHGAGEGGSADVGEATNVEVTLLANKVTALAGEEFQSITGGMNVLVPECPTFWMDNGSGEYQYGKECIYTDSLNELIADYVEKNDIKHVFIGGCSNGGYMTMIMALTNGNNFDGYVPICECIDPEVVDEADAELFASLPMYFVYSKDDDDVFPDKYEEPLFEKINPFNPANHHVSTTEHVIDTSGRYNALNDGNPYQYSGHWSWIYFDNNETDDGTGLTAWDWLASLK